MLIFNKGETGDRVGQEREACGWYIYIFNGTESYAMISFVSTLSIEF